MQDSETQRDPAELSASGDPLAPAPHHSPEQRYCPQCRLATPEVMCPVDGTTTFVFAAVDTARVSQLPPGTVIAGRYRILKRLGRGGFGAVYEAQHNASGQKLALKLLALESEDGAEEVYFRFFQEARATAGLRHPNTVRLYDFGQTEDGILFMAMELLHGPTLHGYMRSMAKENQVLSEGETLTIAVQVLKALQEAHAAGLVHRDLKPENIMLADVGEESPVVKVLDFGIARQIDNGMTVGGRLLGTPKYMSPEQCCGSLDLDARSDLYSLGVILYQCVTGKTPFSGDMFALLSAHISTPLPPLTEHTRTPLSQAFVHALEKALAKEPADRWNDSREMRRAFDEISSSQGMLRRLEVLPSAQMGAPLALTPSGLREPAPVAAPGAAATAAAEAGPATRHAKPAAAQVAPRAAASAPATVDGAAEAATMALAMPEKYAGSQVNSPLAPAQVLAAKRPTGVWIGVAIAVILGTAAAWALLKGPNQDTGAAQAAIAATPAPAAIAPPQATAAPASPAPPGQAAAAAPAPPAALAPVAAPAPAPTTAPTTAPTAAAALAPAAAAPPAPTPPPAAGPAKAKAKSPKPAAAAEKNGAAPIQYLD